MLGTNTKHFFTCMLHRTVFQTGSWDPVTHTYAHTFFPFVWLTTFKSLSLLLLTSPICCAHIHFRNNLQNLGHNLPVLSQVSGVGEPQLQLSWAALLP